MSHILLGFSTYMNIDGVMICKASIVDVKSNLKMTQDGIAKEYESWQCNNVKIDNALVNHILLKIFVYMYVCLKLRNSTQDGLAMFFDIHISWP